MVKVQLKSLLRGSSHSLLVKVQISVVKIMESFSKIDLPYDPAVLLWVYTQWRVFPTKETLVHPGSSTAAFATTKA